MAMSSIGESAYSTTTKRNRLHEFENQHQVTIHGAVQVQV